VKSYKWSKESEESFMICGLMQITILIEDIPLCLTKEMPKPNSGYAPVITCINKVRFVDDIMIY
jgi:hypothetical protein